MISPSRNRTPSPFASWDVNVVVVLHLWCELNEHKNWGIVGFLDFSKMFKRGEEDLFNQALLSKWKWRCINELGAIWVDLLKYRYEDSFDNMLSWETIKTGPNDSIWWRDVARVGDSADDGWFSKNVSCVLGDGKSIRFWKEKWVGEVPLMELYPNLFAIECFKNAAVADRFPDNDHNQAWNWFWRVELSESEMQEVEELQILLTDFIMKGDTGDKWRWIPGKEGVFGWRLLLMKLPTRIGLASKVL
ncbi:hypothetical protein TSUD_392570 [Trifolium subterraneum]|uniref:Reverse transcriptase zinc-binding domain-containing protein n=1 Tax=Trifolium subterraneum TaxID=3900 RepID=A0A2Z6MCN3_TRISU|nr:hypothetical protein TSUD_392570 [Trifolium subterraneum]